MALLEPFTKFVREHHLYHAEERVLLAVSGGIDSVVLAHLVRRAGWSFAVAHCNFQLRGAASDGDEDFVRDLAESYGVPVFVEVFDTGRVAADRGVSIQMAARELRYDWMEGLRSEYGYERIVTAHHLDDSIETVLYNFAKGTGLRGLQGIPVQRDHIVRPLLFATREQIEAYATRERLSYREDASNAEDKYARNLLRRHVVPVLRRLNPAFEQTAAANIDRFRQAEYLFEYAVRQLTAGITHRQGDQLLIDIEGLLSHYRAAPTLLFELLRPFRFHPSQIEQVLASIGRQPGALHYAGDYQLLVDRQHLIVAPRRPALVEQPYVVGEGVERVFLPDGQLLIQYKEGRPTTFTPDPYRALLDAAPLAYPLCLRHWQPGDFFCPLGMGGKRQKLQDFFSNNKVPRLLKDRIWLLETAENELCWVVGYRIDERFRITGQTTRYLELRFLPAS